MSRDVAAAQVAAAAAEQIHRPTHVTETTIGWMDRLRDRPIHASTGSSVGAMRGSNGTETY